MDRHPDQLEAAAVFADAFQHHQAGRLTEAEQLYRNVLAASPHHAKSLENLGVIAYQNRQHDLAIELIREAIAIDAKIASSHSNLGNALKEMGRLDEALVCYSKAIGLKPDYAEACYNLANVLGELGRTDDALEWYRKAIGHKPDYAEAHSNLAQTMLLRGDMAAGWEEYEWRWKTPELGPSRRHLTQSQWRGEPGHGRTLLIHAEQGFGDTLQFCRYAPMAASRAVRVILQVPKPLARLLCRLPGVERVLTDHEGPPAFDLHCPMLSLPLAFGTTLATIPSAVSYLHADPAQVLAWRTRLAAMGIYQGVRVGLVWAASDTPHGRKRSIAPDRLAPLFDVPNLRLFSLQKHGPAAPDALPLIKFMHEMSDFADDAALVANLDLVISVDTATAHLAAALGKPVWLLSRLDSEWRWLTGRRDSPWYPTLRIYRQPSPGDWDSVIAEVAHDLRAGRRLAP